MLSMPRPKSEKYPCIVCSTGETSLTGKCDKCGAVYKRGELIQEGQIRKPVPIRQRAQQKKEGAPIDFYHLPWTAYVVGKDRDDAIKNMMDYYDAKPGRRRTPARKAFEVLDARKNSDGMWHISVRRK